MRGNARGHCKTTPRDCAATAIRPAMFVASHVDVVSVGVFPNVSVGVSPMIRDRVSADSTVIKTARTQKPLWILAGFVVSICGFLALLEVADMNYGWNARQWFFFGGM